MKTKFTALLTILVLTTGTNILEGQIPISQRSWKSVTTGMPDEWYGSEESKTVAENVPLYQRNVGGWPKNIPMHMPLSDKKKAAILKEKGEMDATLDNSATTTEMKFLARMFNKTGNETYSASFKKGLDYILEAQYNNGGWPQFYPLRKGYYTHITFNDDAMVKTMEMLRDIYNKKPLYTFVATDDVAAKARNAFNKGIDCILKTQIIVKGKLTVVLLTSTMLKLKLPEKYSAQ